jgi:hypothetical protein
VFADRLGSELSGERRAFYERPIAAAPQLSTRHRDAKNIALVHGDARVELLPASEWKQRRAVVRLGWLAHRRSDQRSGLHDGPPLVSGTPATPGTSVARSSPSVLLENGVRSYGRADMQEDYRLSVLWHTITPVFQAGLTLPPVLWWHNFQRIMAAVDDLGCRELLD